jgi:hypothetical protein
VHVVVHECRYLVGEFGYLGGLQALQGSNGPDDGLGHLSFIDVASEGEESLMPALYWHAKTGLILGQRMRDDELAVGFGQ